MVPAVLTITANDVTKTYGETLAGGSGSTAFTASGLQNGESVGSVTIGYGAGAQASFQAGACDQCVTVANATGGTFSPNDYTITYVPGKEAGWYLRRAGGTNDVANRKEIFVIRANGSVIGRRSGEWYGANVLGTRLDPGDVIVVPQKIIGGSLFWRNLLTVAQISSSIAITAAVAGII